MTPPSGTIEGAEHEPVSVDAMACYVYGIVPAATSVEGIDVGLGEGVDLVAEGSVAAVVDAVDPERPLGRRRDLVAHSAVLDRLALAGPVLPMRFGGVVTDREAVRDELLRPQAAEFEEMLDEVAGKVQHTVRVRYVLDTVLAEVVAEDPKIAELRRELADLPEEAAHQGNIRLGERVSRAVEARRERDGQAVLDRLAPLVEDVVVKEVSGMDAAFEASFLLSQDASEAFEAAAEDLARDWHGWARVSLVGPMALYDFVGEV